MMDPALIEARVEAYALPLDEIDVSRPELFQRDTIWPYFERLRREDPVHYCGNSRYGRYWSVTRYKDIMEVETHPGTFSSDSGLGGVTIQNSPPEFRLPMFIAMDPPRHDEQRKTVNPIVAPANLANFEPLIRARAGAILDGLPRTETFDWVDRVSIELTTQMLATLFDFPWEDRRLLTYWSDVATVDLKAGGPIDTPEKRMAELRECAKYFTRLWNERVNSEPGTDLISMLAHSPATRHMGPQEFLGNLLLLIVGGNDTTRNSISGGALFLHRSPDEFRKVKADRSLIPGMVSEIIRYQTPVTHMRRTATEDTVLGGKRITKGDKVVMWYISGNRDEEAIEEADRFIVDRARPRQHLSFGFGIHRCVGNRLAELQLRILWEEALKRFEAIEVVGEPVRVFSNLIHGISALPVRIPG